jgi:lipoprotein-anchoring transpeptidase ErfK/SrfK
MKHSAWVACLLLTFTGSAFAETLKVDEVNAAELKEGAGKQSRATIFKAQILLDRHRYSPGVIDGYAGDSTEIALKAFQSDNGIEASGKLDRDTWAKLSENGGGDVLVRYTITDNDLKGPFIDAVPDKIQEMAELDGMHYTGALEALSERHHMDEDALRDLNPGADFDTQGTEIIVAATEGGQDTGVDKDAVDHILVDKSERSLRVIGKDGKLVAFYPATIGSEQNPAPTGEQKVTGVAENPTWTYSPDLKLEGDAAKDRPDKPVVVPAGPNNPVGAVWIDLDKEHFGIHGSAEPSKIGKTMSSGCVRLTNWDVTELAGLVKKDMRVTFQE